MMMRLTIVIVVTLFAKMRLIGGSTFSRTKRNGRGGGDSSTALRDFRRRLNMLEARMGADSEKKRSRRRRSSFVETDLSIGRSDNVKETERSVEETKSPVEKDDDVTDDEENEVENILEQLPTNAGSSAQWRQIAEEVIEHEKNVTESYLARINRLKKRLSDSEKKAVALESQLLSTEQKQQQAFVDQVRKEERLRSKQERFMAQKLAEVAAEGRQRLEEVEETAKVNVTHAEQKLKIVRQRLRNATKTAKRLRGEVEEWKGAAERSFEIGKDRADVKEQLEETKIRLRAATDVAMQWRNESMKSLDVVLTKLIGVNASEALAKVTVAGESPSTFDKKIDRYVTEIEKADADVARRREKIESSYSYPTWELGHS